MLCSKKKISDFETSDFETSRIARTGNEKSSSIAVRALVSSGRRARAGHETMRAHSDYNYALKVKVH